MSILLHELLASQKLAMNFKIDKQNYPMASRIIKDMLIAEKRRAKAGTTLLFIIPNSRLRPDI
ncbi:MAG: hypothetical protein IJV27_11915 [Prevotella sp.]|nr:hypothetical protein [Prevotella sp.]